MTLFICEIRYIYIYNFFLGTPIYCAQVKFLSQLLISYHVKPLLASHIEFSLVNLKISASYSTSFGQALKFGWSLGLLSLPLLYSEIVRDWDKGRRQMEKDKHLLFIWCSFKSLLINIGSLWEGV